MNEDNSSNLQSEFISTLYPVASQHHLHVGDAKLSFIAQGNSLNVEYSIESAFPIVRKKTLVFKDPIPGVRVNFSVPNLPLVLKLATALEIEADATYEATVSIPVFLNVYPSNKRPDQGVQVPTRFIRNSWYGDFSEGELVKYREITDFNEKSSHLPELEAA